MIWSSSVCSVIKEFHLPMKQLWYKTIALREIAPAQVKNNPLAWEANTGNTWLIWLCCLCTHFPAHPPAWMQAKPQYGFSQLWHSVHSLMGSFHSSKLHNLGTLQETLRHQVPYADLLWDSVSLSGEGTWHSLQRNTACVSQGATVLSELLAPVQCDCFYPPVSLLSINLFVPMVSTSPCHASRKVSLPLENWSCSLQWAEETSVRSAPAGSVETSHLLSWQWCGQGPLKRTKHRERQHDTTARDDAVVQIQCLIFPPLCKIQMLQNKKMMYAACVSASLVAFVKYFSIRAQKHENKSSVSVTRIGKLNKDCEELGANNYFLILRS